jgi:acyl dehydratase
MSWRRDVGKTRQSDAVRIDEKRIQNYASGIAEKNRRHCDRGDANYSAPPLVVAASIIPGTGSMLAEVKVPADLMRIVHGSIDINLRRPIVEGDELSCVASFQGVDEKSSGTLINFGFDVRDAKGKTVSNGSTHYFVRGKIKGEKKAADSSANGTPAVAPTVEVKETIEEGLSVRYAEGSGDSFPIHTDPNFAKNVGLPDVILHGMCTLAVSTRAIVDQVLDGDSSRLRNVGVRFSKMVFHGDELTTRIWKDGKDIQFETMNQKGDKVLADGHARVSD